jgi:hypothetical protein
MTSLVQLLADHRKHRQAYCRCTGYYRARGHAPHDVVQPRQSDVIGWASAAGQGGQR